METRMVDQLSREDRDTLITLLTVGIMNASSGLGLTDESVSHLQESLGLSHLGLTLAKLNPNHVHST